MKPYSKPVIEETIINDINEPVFLGGSNWSNSECYIAYLVNTQIPETGNNRINIQVYGDHIAGEADYSGTQPGHHNHNQWFIFGWTAPVPDDITVTLNGVDVVWNADRTKCRTYQSYHQNANEQIGSDAFYMQMTDIDGTSLTKAELALYQPSSFFVSDYGLRKCEHGNWN